jgi:hypothetical protein
LSFLPLHNPLGFGVSDWVAFGLALILLALALAWRPWLEPGARRFASRTGWAMLLLAALPIVLRLLLLPNHPVPTPDIYDEFGHLLVADTLRHWRLANPPHPLHQFFETFFVLQEPSYSSIYPIGQGLMLAIGWTIFGLPWAGVLISMGALCALCYWMLRAWTTPGWALAGGALAIIEFGPLNLWTNSYWGGSLAAAAGCLVFGALPRLRASARVRDAVLLGSGAAVFLLIRPYESIFLVLSAALFLAPAVWRLRKPLGVTALTVVPAIGITLAQNKQVTGSWTTWPYVLSQYQYGVPAALTFQRHPVPHRPLTPQQALEYQVQIGFRGPHPETVGSYLLRLWYRVRFYRFFFLAPLYLALPAFLLRVREYRFLWVVLAVTLFALGINFFPAFQFHYMAGVTCLFILISVAGLERMSRRHAGFARVILLLCVAQFAVWYGAHLFDYSALSREMRRYETWETINHGNPARRIFVKRELARLPGKILVFVRYWPQHIFQDEWVYNRADIDGARVVWARDLGAEENDKLLRYYPGRSAWLLEPDAQPPRLTPYR